MMFGQEKNEDGNDSDFINVTHKKDGTQDRYKRRRLGLSGYKNHSLSNDFIEGAISKLALIRAAALALLAVAGVVGSAIVAVDKYYVAPRQTVAVSEAVEKHIAPILARLDEDEKLFRDHLIDIERQRDLFPTKMDFERSIDEIKATLIRMEGRR